MTDSLVVLTTDTPHHRYFAREIGKAVRLVEIVVETAQLKAPFETAHPFEQQRDEYERDGLLNGNKAEFSEVAPVRYTEDVNESAVIAELVKRAPAIVVVFGTRRLKREAIGSARVACINLHGGDPRQYRGLDTHLWAIYHSDFGALVATLHHVDLDLDTGDLIELKPVPLRRGMELYELRAANTRVCVDLVKSAVRSEQLPRIPQASKGRYYSFMPACLKALCVEKFRKHAGSI